MGLEITGSAYCEQRLLLETNGFIDSAFTDNEVLTVMNDYAAKIHCNPDTKEIIAQLGSKHFAIKKANCKTLEYVRDGAAAAYDALYQYAHENYNWNSPSSNEE